MITTIVDEYIIMRDQKSTNDYMRKVQEKIFHTSFSI